MSDQAQKTWISSEVARIWSRRRWKNISPHPQIPGAGKKIGSNLPDLFFDVFFPPIFCRWWCPTSRCIKPIGKKVGSSTIHFYWSYVVMQVPLGMRYFRHHHGPWLETCVFLRGNSQTFICQDGILRRTRECQGILGFFSSAKSNQSYKVSPKKTIISGLMGPL